MIERYTLPEMGRLWSEEAKFQSWLDVEIAACQANAELGRVPAEAMAQIRERARFEVPRILEIGSCSARWRANRTVLFSGRAGSSESTGSRRPAASGLRGR